MRRQVEAIPTKVCLISDIHSLPREPGVYLFCRNDTILYIGKSIDLRQRVQSHVSAAKRGGRETKYVSAATVVRYEICVSELRALLLESALIKQYQPLYNKRLRRQRDLWSWQLPADPASSIPALVRHQWPPPEECFQWGLFRNRTKATEALRALCREEFLCEQTLGLTQGKGPCFQFQLRRCSGACAGREDPEAHSQRVHRAFTSRAHNIWPYQGIITVRHEKKSQRVSALHAWKYLGDYDSIEEAREQLGKDHLDHSNKTIQLDLDAFRIVLNFLHKQASCITPLHQ